MDFEISEITVKGHALLAKVLAGETSLRISSVYAGSGEYDGDIGDITELVCPMLEGDVINLTSDPMSVNARMVTRFTNETVSNFFMLTEVGIFAEDPVEGEILYAYAKAGNRPSFIPEYNGLWPVEVELTLYFYTANTSNIEATIVKAAHAYEIAYDNAKSGLAAGNVQDAIDEIGSMHPLLDSLTHGLNDFPLVLTIETDSGYGAGAYGETIYGGTTGKQVRNRVEYIDQNSIALRVEGKYGEIESIEQISEKEYVVTFADSTLSLFIALITDYNISGDTGEGSGGNESGSFDMSILSFTINDNGELILSIKEDEA